MTGVAVYPALFFKAFLFNRKTEFGNVFIEVQIQCNRVAMLCCRESVAGAVCRMMNVCEKLKKMLENCGFVGKSN